MRLAIIGTGYVGLVTGTCFAAFGHEVVCVDTDAAKIKKLADGQIPIYEPGIEALVHSASAAGCLSFTTDLPMALQGASIAFLCVGTPLGADGTADLGAVFAAAKAIGQALAGPTIIVTKSTVPVGTTERVRDTIAGITSQSFAVASNPEFLKEGDAVRDFQRPDRVVLGVDSADQATLRTLRRLYEPFVREPDQILEMDIRSAEFTKYASNAMLATRISFMNEMALLCERTGADVTAVRHGVGADARIGGAFLYAGLGYGGSCFPKDVAALAATAREHGVDLPIVSAAQRVNERMRVLLFEKILRHFGGPVSTGEGASALPLAGKTIAVWGLAFKPETDDIREAPALDLINRLLCAGALIRASDPVAAENVHWHYVEKVREAHGVLPGPGRLEPGSDRRTLGLTFHQDAYEAARGADALVLCTEWRQYRQPDFARLRDVMVGEGMFDGRNIWDPQVVRAAGFTYYGIGRP